MPADESGAKKKRLRERDKQMKRVYQTRRDRIFLESLREEAGSLYPGRVLYSLLRLYTSQDKDAKADNAAIQIHSFFSFIKFTCVIFFFFFHPS